MPILLDGRHGERARTRWAVTPMTRVVINFPYSGSEKEAPREELFWKIVQTCASNGTRPIIVVMDQDTITRGGADAFLHDARVGKYDLRVHRTSSVDTCDRWLAGWAVALGMLPCAGAPGDQALTLPEPDDNDRIILLPGDIDAVAKRNNFFNASLPGFLAMNGTSDIVVGDFETGEKLASKDLIDLHGTYPLFALWFPEIAAAARDKSIWKPRSEFVNVRTCVLRELLSKRRFAYEQTLNMLIHSWDFATGEPAEEATDAKAIAKSEAPKQPGWRYHIAVFPLGEFADDPDERNIPGAIDQIERTERMLKMIWREKEFTKAITKAKNDAKELASRSRQDERDETYEKEFHRIFLEEAAKILRQYDHLEATSRAIEVAARVTVLSFIAR